MNEFCFPGLESLRSVTLSILDPQRSVHTLRPLVIELTRLLAHAGTFRIDLVLVNTSREFTFNPPEGHRSGSQRDRIPVASVFVLNRETVDSWKGISENRLPAALVRIPDAMEKRYQPMLFTTIRVYRNHILKDYNSSLTCPRKLARDGSIKAGDTIQFQYELGDVPQLVPEVYARPD